MIDLRSDTVTKPTAEMRAAMASAEVGDDVYGEDPTVNRLESLAAAMLGKEAALYVPSGTMANQLAVRVLGRPGTEALCGARAHVYRSEGAAAALNSGVQMRPVPDAHGRFGPDELTFPRAAHEGPPVSLLCLENTYMPEHGLPWTASEIDACVEVARANGVAVHIDGARIFNAAIALGTPPAELCDGADTVMFCLSKGLGAPVGSVLCGPRDVITEARAQRQRFGGAMRQAGVIAAAGLVALETGVDALALDHERARRLADALAQRWPGSVDPSAVRTNIVCADATVLPDAFVVRLRNLGVAAGMLDARTVRLVTHRDVDDADVDDVISAFDALATPP